MKDLEMKGLRFYKPLTNSVRKCRGRLFLQRKIWFSVTVTFRITATEQKHSMKNSESTFSDQVWEKEV